MQVTDEINENDALAPIANTWFRTVFSPNQHNLDQWDRREIQTYCRLIDFGLRGEMAQLLDMAMQRLKAKVLACADGHWQSAQHLELLPSAKAAGILSMGEEEFVRKVNAGEIRLADLLQKIHGSGGGGGSSKSS